MPVHRRDERPVRPLVDRRPGMREAEQPRTERRKQRAADRPVHRERVRVGKSPSTDRLVCVRRHRHEHERLECREEAADRQPVRRHADEIVMMRGPEQAGDERQGDDDVEPLLHHLTIDAGEADEQVGQQRPLDHFPDSLDPEMDRPPSVEDRDRIVVELEQRRQIQDCGEREPRHQDAFRRRESFGLPDRHAEVVEKHQHDDDDGELDGQRLLEELVSGGPSKEIADDCSDAGQRPQAERDSTPASGCAARCAIPRARASRRRP